MTTEKLFLFQAELLLQVERQKQSRVERRTLSANPARDPRPGPLDLLGFLLLGVAFVLSGCATQKSSTVERQTANAQPALDPRPLMLDPEPPLSPAIQAKIMALDPENVSQKEISEVLAHAPAPRIINIHGGILPRHANMNSFSEFLIGMGYPAASIRHPNDGNYTFGYYHKSDMIAGLIAWYYETDGLRPMLVGFSQGGFQAMRVLHKLAGDSVARLSVWNPLTEASEERYDITDPLTGKIRPVIGLQVSYACVAVAGGLGRWLPNQWDMNDKLRKIPDSVEEFTGFQKGLDPLGGDYLGYGASNDYKATGSAIVRNVRLPSAYGHASIPDTRHLAKDPAIRDWLSHYRPTDTPADTPQLDMKFSADSSHILWAAEVWYCIKKHWVLELQRKIRAQQPAVIRAGR
jgi:pimeloyl-ACP methyl ester carboxylesterase